MSIFLIIILLAIAFWPWISKWLRIFMARRAEDMMRRMAGMPSRKEEQRRRKQRQRQQQQRRQSAYPHDRARRDNSQDPEEGLRSMQEYAEDVEFTEIKEYSETTIRQEGGNGNTRIYHESQVSDVEFTETKS